LLLDTASKHIRTIPPPEGNLNGINTAVYSSKGNFLVAGGAAGVLRQWDLGAKAATVKFNYQIDCPILTSAVSPEGDIIAVTASDKVIRLLNAADGSLIKKLMIGSDGVNQLLLFAKGGEMLISIEPLDDNCHPSLIRFWDVKGGSEICSPIVGHKYRIVSACRNRSRVEQHEIKGFLQSRGPF
jgi:WD40 repeat protein